MKSARALWPAVVILLLGCAALQIAGLDLWLRYSRAGIGAGEWWRLVTGHLVHLGAAHLAMNALGAVLVAWLVGAHLRPLAWAVTALACALGIGMGLFWGRPDLEWYVGLSGVLHGLLVAGGVAALADQRERGFAGILLMAVIAKLAWEQVSGAATASAALAGGAVVVDAHLFGAITGAIAGAIALIGHYWRVRARASCPKPK
jgi:rhomboid family GlyGly-CTERM serine protease